MRKLFLLLLLSMQATSLFSQIAAYDAMKLNNYLGPNGKFPNDEASKKAYSTILTKYLATDETLNKLKDPKINPFLTDFFDQTQTYAELSVKEKSMYNANVASSIEGTDVTNLVNGIADLMIERAKQELTIAFFNQFKTFVQNHPEMQVLFPETMTTLNGLLSYAYPQWLPNLRNSFFDDLKQLPNHLQGVLTFPDFQKTFGKLPEVGLAINALQLGQNLADGSMNAADVLNSLATNVFWNNPAGGITFKNIGSLVKFANLFSQELRNDPTVNPAQVVSIKKQIWIPGQNAKPLLTNASAGKLFLGLIYQELKISPIYYFESLKDSVSLIKYMDNNANNIAFFQTKLAAFLQTASKVGDIIDNLKPRGSLTDSALSSYIAVSIDALSNISDVVNFFDKKFSAGNYLTIASKANAVYKDIYTKQYTQAIGDGIDLLTDVHDMITKTQGATDQTKNRSFLDVVQKIKPYAIFAANMAEAKTSDDVKAALENAVLPVGSSSIKKNTHNNISIQSYLGGYCSPWNNYSSLTGAWSDKFGITAPIGISWTPGFLSMQKGGSISLFASLFDIGAIIDYKLQMDSTVNSAGATQHAVSKTYSIKLGQIISPGVYLVYGFFSNLPLAIGIGGQYGPGLSKIDAGGNAVVANPTWRTNIFLSVDLPFFNIVNRPKSK